ncbi:MAG: EAL domain-containing protein [Aestuariivirga sp.]
MKKFKTSRIGKRIATLVAVTVLMSILTIASLLVWFQVTENIASRKNGLRATAFVYASAIAEPVARGDGGQARSILSSIARVPDVLFATALDSHNHALAKMGNAIFLEDDVILQEQGTLAMLTKGTLPVAVDIVRGGETIGRLVLIADVRPVRSQLLWTLLATVMAALLASLIGAVIAVPLQRRITVPILSLIAAMRQIKESRHYTTKVNHTADDETGDLVDTFNQMITEISYRDNALERMAYFDPLTGLANRQYFQKQVEDYLGTLKDKDFSAALYLLDLDEFKQINDAFGHTTGDALLMNVAAILKQETADDCILARLGGDEFVIVARNVASESGAQEKLAPFIAALYQPLKILRQEMRISTSVGVAMIPRDGKSMDELMRRADLALYSAKREGPGLVHFFQPAMEAAVKAQADTAQALHQAISNNEFESHYQPQFDLWTGDVHGFESLIRWRRPERGLISPDQFISVAENTGLIRPIGNWILRNSCRHGRTWIDEGHGEREISVNISVVQLLQADFPDEVSAILRETGFPPHLLCLELTESLFIGKSVAKAKAVLDDLKSLGISLALDDFGTGYSSLSYLEKLPFDTIKIDRSFVKGIEDNPGKRSLLTGIISLGHSLGRVIVAEGAETAGEVRLLRELGADIVQGYALSWPVAADKAIAAAQAASRTYAEKFGGHVAKAS